MISPHRFFAERMGARTATVKPVALSMFSESYEIQVAIACNPGRTVRPL
jgi:hypothetical protein